MAKKKFEYMSSNEWLGDATTHFMKSGDAFRSPDNHEQEQLATLIPKKANGVKVEYDIGYDIPDKIHGYKYTDFLTKCIYISPCSHAIAKKNITEVAGLGPTEEGRYVVEQLRKNLTDKYLLDNDDTTYKPKQLIVLPGTNLLVKDVVDMEKVDKLVSEGAYVKLHPITAEVWRTMLKNRWKDKCIPADAPLYPILKSAEKVFFTMSSETGIASTLLGKQLGLINSDKPSKTNFEFIYRGLDAQRNGGKLIDKLTSLFSHPESGFITVYHENPEQRIKQFFEHTKKRFPHK